MMPDPKAVAPVGPMEQWINDYEDCTPRDWVSFLDANAARIFAREQDATIAALRARNTELEHQLAAHIDPVESGCEARYEEMKARLEARCERLEAVCADAAAFRHYVVHNAVGRGGDQIAFADCNTGTCVAARAALAEGGAS